MQTPVLDRFLRYVSYDTQSREGAEAYPSTPGQLVLLEDLVSELRGMGLQDAAMDEHGYVTATIPATTGKTGVPVIGFIAHVDTSPEMSGAGVKPIVHRDYDGQRPRPAGRSDGGAARRRHPVRWPSSIGHDIVTASGTTLLGADNKAGVAEIVAAAEYLHGAPGDSARADPRSRSRPTRKSGAGTEVLRRARGSAPATPTRWTAARAASWRSRASRPTR